MGRGTILVVEDDEMVRQMTRSMLLALGYRVLTAATPHAALALCAEPTTHIDLLVTDVVMPNMKGPELRDKIRAMRPHLNVLFMSGYTPSVLVGEENGDERVAFIQKPFTMTDLARSVAGALRGPRADGA